MRPFFVALSLFVVTAAGAAEIDAAVAAMNGMEASFTHRFTAKGFRTSQTESGSVTFGKLPMMRWVYQTPEQKTFVFDGQRSWFYVPAENQVTIGEIDDKRRGELPFLVLGDPAARQRLFVVKESRRGNAVTTTLQPRSRTAQIRSVTIVTNASSHRIQSVEYTDRDGNRTSFAFSRYHPARVSADTFRFTPPAGVQSVRAD
jgi:outer membrane lipoprotein carrier protein